MFFSLVDMLFDSILKYPYSNPTLKIDGYHEYMYFVSLYC